MTSTPPQGRHRSPQARRAHASRNRQNQHAAHAERTFLLAVGSALSALVVAALAWASAASLMIGAISFVAVASVSGVAALAGVQIRTRNALLAAAAENERLREQEAARVVAIASASHELRNQLTPIELGLFLLGPDQLSPEGREAWSMMRAALDRVHRIAGDASAAGDGAPVSLQPRSTRLAPVLEEAAQPPRPPPTPPGSASTSTRRRTSRAPSTRTD